MEGLDLEMGQKRLDMKVPAEHIHAQCGHEYQPVNLPVSPRWSLWVCF